MTDLEKLITALLDIPSTDLEGNEDTMTVQWASASNGSTAFVKLGEWEDSIHLDPTQALELLDWLKEQRENLETLQEALRAQQIEDASTKEQREAERLNALKALHSEAVTAWQDGGCMGPCPTFEYVVFKESFVRHDLDNPDGVTSAVFVKQYPMLERLRKARQG